MGETKREKRQLALRLGWPATEWEMGPEPKMAGEMAGQIAGGHFSGGSDMAEKMAGKMAGQPKIGQILAGGRRPFGRPFLVLGPFPIL